MKVTRCCFLWVCSLLLVASGWCDTHSIQGLPALEPDMMRIFLVRHAETLHNAKSGVELTEDEYYRITEKGEAQCRAIGEMRTQMKQARFKLSI